MIACGTSSRSPLNSRTASQADLNSRYRPTRELNLDSGLVFGISGVVERLSRPNFGRRNGAAEVGSFFVMPLLFDNAVYTSLPPNYPRLPC